MDSVPFNIETNVAAVSYLVHNYPKQIMFRTDYPEYNARVKYGIVYDVDSATLMKAYDSQLTRMGERVYYSYFSKDPIANDSLKGWIFTSLPDQAPVQMIVTDSASIMLHGTMEFLSPQTDTVGIIQPAAEAIAADMEHIVKNLKLK